MTRRILITVFCDGRTNICRSYNLAVVLAQAGLEVHIAGSSVYMGMFGAGPWQVHDLPELDQQMVKDKVRHWDLDWHTPDSLSYFIEQESRLIQQVKPDLIINFFRFSIIFSARQHHIPVCSVLNADFTPYYEHRFSRELLLKVTKKLGLPFGDILRNVSNTDLLARATMSYFEKESKRLLQPYKRWIDKYDLHITNYFQLLEGDHNFLLDLPELLPLSGHHVNYHYTGPVFYRVSGMDAPDIDHHKRNVLICADSSDQHAWISDVVASIPHDDWEVMIIGAEKEALSGMPGLDHCRVIPMLDLACMHRFDLVISSGSRDIYYNALRAGVPVVVCPQLMDHMFFADVVQRKGGAVIWPEGESFDTIASRVAGTLCQVMNLRKNLLKEKSEDIISALIHDLFF